MKIAINSILIKLCVLCFASVGFFSLINADCAYCPRKCRPYTDGAMIQIPGEEQSEVFVEEQPIKRNEDIIVSADEDILTEPVMKVYEEEPVATEFEITEDLGIPAESEIGMTEAEMEAMAD